ncbi:MAG: V-type ATP synthase subunit D [Firmicutes bacterium]|nr:V-type ATP synthase subunit D [Bacillota bacterium]
MKQINPTRIELRKSKIRLAAAIKGHKLLKDKSDEMIRQFLDLVAKAKALRRGLSPLVLDSLSGFALAKAQSVSFEASNALKSLKREAFVLADQKSIMGVNVPVFCIYRQKIDDKAAMAVVGSDSILSEKGNLSPDLGLNLSADNHAAANKGKQIENTNQNQSDFALKINYALPSAPAVLDKAVFDLNSIFHGLINLAEAEKSCALLSIEIEKTRRRVNALEHIMIPDLKHTIAYIQMKLDENERGALARLMQVKAKIVSEE